MSLLHRGFEFPLDDVLDLFVDGQYDILSRVWLLLDAAEPLAPGDHRDQHAAGLAAKLFVIGTLDSAQALVIHADITENLRRQIPFGIEPLRFLLEMDA